MENCSCIYVGFDGDTTEFCSEKIVVSRKNHKCCECHSVINIGEKYEYVFGKWDGETSCYKTCMDCLSIREVFFCDGWFYTMIHENLYDHVQEMKGEISEDCLNIFSHLTPKAIGIICELIERVWQND